MISKFSQCIISGRDSMLSALLITAVLGRIVRGHHTFMGGVDLVTRSGRFLSGMVVWKEVSGGGVVGSGVVGGAGGRSYWTINDV